MNSLWRLLCRWQVIATALCLTQATLPAHALDPNKAVSQYIRTGWTPGNGFPHGRINAIGQSSDGYLWVATDSGLLRFDGSTFVPAGQPLPTAEAFSKALALTTDAAGDLWVKNQSLNLVRYRNGRFDEPMTRAGLFDLRVTAITRGRDGGILMSTQQHTSLRFTRGKAEVLAARKEFSPGLVLSIAETPDGRIWLGTRDEGLYYLDHGQVSSLRDDLPDRKINCLLPADGSKLWIGTDSGLVLWDGTRIAGAALPDALSHGQILALAKDHDANVWIGTGSGLFRMNATGVSMEQPARNRPGPQVTALFEDREGDLWIGGSQGLEKLRDGAFSTYSTDEGLPSETSGPIFVDAKGATWIAPSGGGLYRIEGGRAKPVPIAGVGNDIVYSIAGDGDSLWIGRQLGGLTHLVLNGDKIAAETYTHAQGLAQNSVSSVFLSNDGAVWAGTFSGGVSRFQNNQFITYTTGNGLGSNTVSSILQSPDGTMWFATAGGLSKFSSGKWQTYTEQDNLPSSDVISLLLDSSGTLWVGTSSGLAWFSSKRLETSPAGQAMLREPIFGMAEDKSGALWMATPSRVLRVNKNELLNGHLNDRDIRQYSAEDGLLGTAGVRRDHSVVEDSHGRIWFSLIPGISVVDPARDISGQASSIAHVESVTDDGALVDMQGKVALAPSPQRITISFTGLGLAVPDRVRFRYKLTGFDRQWSDPVATRQVVYTNLGPGPYEFRVLASDGDGQWNGAEATLQFRIEPAVWQTWWFRLGCVLLLILVTWLLYLVRMQEITRQLSIRFEERLSERMRIAQELHDGLLQGVISASMQLHVAAEVVPQDSPVKPMLSRVLQLMNEVTEEGRRALRGIRSSGAELRDLEHALSAIPEELALSKDAAYRVIVEGPPRHLNPAVRDEVYRIGREALVNAFRHAQASSIEVQVEYTTGHLQMVVRDDGCGIDPEVLDTGRAGHWGIAGMRERAQRIGGKLRIWSRAVAGTEVELSVPANVAYKVQPRSSLLRWFRFPHSRSANIHKPGGEPNL